MVFLEVLLGSLWQAHGLRDGQGVSRGNRLVLERWPWPHSHIPLPSCVARLASRDLEPEAHFLGVKWELGAARERSWTHRLTALLRGAMGGTPQEPLRVACTYAHASASFFPRKSERATGRSRPWLLPRVSPCRLHGAALGAGEPPAGLGRRSALCEGGRVGLWLRVLWAGWGPDVGVSPQRSGWPAVAVSACPACPEGSFWESAGEAEAHPSPVGLFSVGDAFGIELWEDK